jgi:hypothetical protein
MGKLSRAVVLTGAILTVASVSPSGRNGFFEVRGRDYRGAIVPAERIPRWLGGPETGWTPTRDQAARAEAALRTHLTWGIQNRERFEPRADEHVRFFLSDVVAALPTFTRYYIGQASADGRRVLLVIGAAEPYTRAGGVDTWRTHVPYVIDGACS